MVHILPSAKQPSFLESLGIGASQALPGAVDKYFADRKEQQKTQQRDQALQQLSGMDMSNLPPEMQQAFLVEQLKQGRVLESQKMKQEMLQKKAQQEEFVDQESVDRVKDVFGDKFAEIWKSAPIGGKTELLKQGIGAKLRGDNLEQMLSGMKEQAPENKKLSVADTEEKIPQLENGKISKDFAWPDFAKRPDGYTPKDWVNERKTWRKENAPMFIENKTKLQNNKKDAVAIKNLGRLNKKMPEGLERLIINPETGEPYGLAQLFGKASPEVQEWVKETARFQNRAKDTFGSRVTNFDLVSYMKQFPGLLNTKEGRSRIIGMMNINNELDQLYETAVSKIYEKYGLNGIPMEEAEKLAQSMIQDKTDKLTDEYLRIDDRNQTEESAELSGRMVDVKGPDGQIYEVDEKEVERLQPGFILL